MSLLEAQRPLLASAFDLVGDVEAPVLYQWVAVLADQGMALAGAVAAFLAATADLLSVADRLQGRRSRGRRSSRAPRRHPRRAHRQRLAKATRCLSFEVVKQEVQQQGACKAGKLLKVVQEQAHTAGSCGHFHGALGANEEAPGVEVNPGVVEEVFVDEAEPAPPPESVAGAELEDRVLELVAAPEEPRQAAEEVARAAKSRDAELRGRAERCGKDLDEAANSEVRARVLELETALEEQRQRQEAEGEARAGKARDAVLRGKAERCDKDLEVAANPRALDAQAGLRAATARIQELEGGAARGRKILEDAVAPAAAASKAKDAEV